MHAFTHSYIHICLSFVYMYSFLCFVIFYLSLSFLALMHFYHVFLACSIYSFRYVYHIFISYNLIFISCHLLVTSYIVLYQTIISYDIYIYISILVRFTCTFIYFLYFSCLIILFFSSILHDISKYIAISCSYLSLFLSCIPIDFTHAICTLGTTIKFSIFGYQMPLNIIWLDSRLNGISTESKNTRNRVRTKELL